MIIYTHNDCLKKFNGHTHPERKERLESILSSIKSSNLKVEFKEAPLADLETVSLVHPKHHIEQIFSNIPTSTAETLQNTVAGIGSFISSDSLQQMRRDSPTGGALGNSSDADLQLLRDAHGRMNPFGDPQILKRQLRDFKQLLTEVIARNRAKAMEIGGKSGADLENAVTVNSENNLSKADRIVNFKPRNK